MRVAVVIATFGHQSWEQMARNHACPSAVGQVDEVRVKHLASGTLAQARNQAAADTTTSDWLCFLDADDRLAAGYIEAMKRAFCRHTLTGGEAMTESGPLPTRLGPLVPQPLLAPAVSYDNDVSSAIPNKGRWPDLNECVIGTLVRRDLFMQVGGFHEWPSLEDYDLWLRCVKAGAEIVHVPEAVYVASSGRHRNADQSPYHQIRSLHTEVFRDRLGRR